MLPVRVFHDTMRSVRDGAHIGGFLLLIACAEAPSPTVPPDVAPIPLEPATGQVGGFDMVSSAVSLPDGRLAILQPDCIVVIDFGAARADTIRRDGEGPGEFRGPMSIGLGPTGKLVVVDRSSRVVLVPVNGEAGTTLQRDRPIANPFWARPDTLGTLFVAEYRKGVDKAPASTIDTLLIARMQATGGIDTVGTFAAARFQVVPGSKGSIALSIMFAPIDAWGVTPAGDLWQLRGVDFRPRWWERATGRWREGASRPWRPIPVTALDRGTLPPHPRVPGLDTILRPAADVKPPFLEAVADPNGEIWARLSQPHGASSELVVILSPDRDASNVLRQMPAGRRLVALDTSFVYATTEMEDGTWTMERYHRRLAGRTADATQRVGSSR